MTNENKNIAMEISDDELEGVSGGTTIIQNADSQYRSGSKPKFSVGDKVSALSNSGIYKYEGLVDTVSKTPTGMINPEFSYTVKWYRKYNTQTNQGVAYSDYGFDVFESQLKKI